MLTREMRDEAAALTGFGGADATVWISRARKVLALVAAAEVDEPPSAWAELCGKIQEAADMLDGEESSIGWEKMARQLRNGCRDYEATLAPKVRDGMPAPTATLPEDVSGRDTNRRTWKALRLNGGNYIESDADRESFLLNEHTRLFDRQRVLAARLRGMGASDTVTEDDCAKATPVIEAESRAEARPALTEERAKVSSLLRTMAAYIERGDHMTGDYGAPVVEPAPWRPTPGARVVTVARLTADVWGWPPHAVVLARRRPGARGVVIALAEHHWWVRHDDGGLEAPYATAELLPDPSR